MRRLRVVWASLALVALSLAACSALFTAWTWRQTRDLSHSFQILQDRLEQVSDCSSCCCDCHRCSPVSSTAAVAVTAVVTAAVITTVAATGAAADVTIATTTRLLLQLSFPFFCTTTDGVYLSVTI